MKKICTICGREFIRTSNSNKYCSVECSYKAYSIHRKEYIKTEKYKDSVKKHNKTDKVKQAQKKYNETLKGKIKSKRYVKSFKGRVKQVKANHKRRALKRNCIHDDYSVWIKEVKALKKFTCHWCNEVFDINKLHIDHVIPLSKGGSDTKDNVVCACGKCNCHKQAILPEDFNKTLKQPLLIFS